MTTKEMVKILWDSYFGNGKKGLKFWVLIGQVQIAALIFGMIYVVKLLVEILSKIKGV